MDVSDFGTASVGPEDDDDAPAACVREPSGPTGPTDRQSELVAVVLSGTDLRPTSSPAGFEQHARRFANHPAQ